MSGLVLKCPHNQMFASLPWDTSGIITLDRRIFRWEGSQINSSDSSLTENIFVRAFFLTQILVIRSSGMITYKEI